MGVNEDVEIIATLNSHFLNLFDCPSKIPGHGNREIIADFGNRRPCLDGIAPDALNELYSGFAASAGVDTDLIPRRTADELVNRQVCYFSENVPERDIYCTQRRAEKNPDMPAVPAVQSLPELLDIRRILPDEMPFHVFDTLGDGSDLVVTDRTLTQSGYTFGGPDLHETAVAFHQECIHGGYLNT